MNGNFFFEEEEASMKVKEMFAMVIKGRTKSIRDKVLNSMRASQPKPMLMRNGSGKMKKCG